MNILFINPASKCVDHLPLPPLGLLYLAAYIRQNGYANIEIFDNNIHKLPYLELCKLIKRFDVVAITGTTAQYKNAVLVSEIAKKYNALSIFGGPHASSLPIECARRFDIVVVGEGEQTLLEVLDCIKDCKRKMLNKIDGICFSDNYGVILSTAPRKQITNLDDLPMPALDLIDIKQYGHRELKRWDGTYMHMMTSRGCKNRCTFCSSAHTWQRSVRFHSAERVFAEMMRLYVLYGIKNIHFQDDTFTLDYDRAMKICSLIIASGIDFRWSCQTRPTCVEEVLLKTMRMAGCVQVEMGVESGDDAILKRARKGYTTKQIAEAFDLVRKAGIRSYGFMMVGLPGETIRTWLKSILFAKKIKANSVVWTVLVPFPGTALFNSKELDVLDWDYENWMYKRPLIRSGFLAPCVLSAMRWIADKLTNGFWNRGTYK